jgi:hypothetical protein
MFRKLVLMVSLAFILSLISNASAQLPMRATAPGRLSAMGPTFGEPQMRSIMPMCR